MYRKTTGLIKILWFLNGYLDIAIVKKVSITHVIK